MTPTLTRKYHIPVMMPQCIEGLDIKPKGVYVDVTFGGGGHSRAILDQLDSDGLLIAFDQDPDAKSNLPENDNFIFVDHNFQYFKNFLKFYNHEKVDGILADLGISSHQIDEGSLGFSFRHDAPLNMRMDQSSELTAYEVINTYSEEDLTRIFKTYGELRYARKFASTIGAYRLKKSIETTLELANLASEFIPLKQRSKELARLFQAIRIEVNQELEVLRRFLDQCADSLKPGGRLVVMSYHSLEDRLVKNLMTTGSVDGDTISDEFGPQQSPFKLLNRKPITPDDEELQANPRSRSAKLRIAEKR